MHYVERGENPMRSLNKGIDLAKEEEMAQRV